MKIFQDTQQILALIKHFQSYGVVRHNKEIYNSKYLSTNSGLFSALSLVITQIINALSGVHDLGGEMGSEDSSSAQKSIKKFTKILNSNEFNDLKEDSNNGGIRKKVIQQLKDGKAFFFTIKDMKNPTYHNKKNYANIILYDHKKLYVNDDCISQYMWDKNEFKFDKKIHNKVIKNNNKANPNSVLYRVPDIRKSKVLSDDKSEIKRTKKKVDRVLKKHGINPDSKYTIRENPKASDDTDMPRVVKINKISFFYNPKYVSLQHIIHMNVPFLSNDQNSYDVINDKKHHVIYQY